MGPVENDKRSLRRTARAARDRLDDGARAAASAAIAQRLADLPELAGARRVLGYAATGREVDLDGWLAARLAAGTDVHLPWVVPAPPDRPELRLARIRDLAELRPGWRGLREPRHAPGDHGVDPALVDAAVVPGLAFDREGRRLGQGGGHIDALLARLRPGALRVGVAFEVQVLDRPLPQEAHDVRVHLVVTEQGIRRAG